MSAPASSAFISYSREDSEFALRLAQDLKAAGADVWLDQLDIKPGHPWDNAIEDALTGAPEMLVILSPASSKSGNVRDEIDFALRAGKIVVPILYVDCAIPLRLGRTQRIDFRADYARGLAHLLEILRVASPDPAVLEKAVADDAQRQTAWQARDAEAQRLRDLSERDQGDRTAREELRSSPQAEAARIQEDEPKEHQRKEEERKAEPAAEAKAAQATEVKPKPAPGLSAIPQTTPRVVRCSHCGAELQGDERFCVVCGADVSALTKSTPASVIAKSPAPPAFAAAPGPAPPIPAFVGTPQPPAKTGSKVWTWVLIAVVILGAYYFSHKASTTTPTPAPAQPGVQGSPVTPVQQQNITGSWHAIYGYVEVTNASWTNNSPVTIQSATLQCTQYAANGANVAQTQMVLNGPVQPGGTTTFNPFQMGSVSMYMSRVNCLIVAVTPAN
ncbi:MAG: TIR domain-containing protein [Acidobacteriaceae bacterium]